MGAAHAPKIVRRGAEQILVFEQRMIEAGVEWAEDDAGADCQDYVSPLARFNTFIDAMS